MAAPPNHLKEPSTVSLLTPAVRTTTAYKLSLAPLRNRQPVLLLIALVLGCWLLAFPGSLVTNPLARWIGIGLCLAAIVRQACRLGARGARTFMGRRLGPYQVIQHLGGGGMGDVYLAEHLALGRLCAVKVIRPDRAGDSKTRRRFEREVAATARLTSPHTVTIFDQGHAGDGTWYYAMEYLPGLNLRDLVRRHGPLSPERAVYFLRQVCLALSEAHAAGLVHRDIKPSNIIVCERGRLFDVVKLVDFGMVRTFGASPDGENLTEDGSMAGTPAYMAPEQAAGHRQWDGRADLYSLGALAFFLLTGRAPFEGRSPMAMAAAHIYEAVPPLTAFRLDVPADLQEVIRRCLEKDPDRRFPDANALEQALATCTCTASWSRQQAAAWWQGSLAMRAAPGEETTPEKIGPGTGLLLY